MGILNSESWNLDKLITYIHETAASLKEGPGMMLATIRGAKKIKRCETTINITKSIEKEPIARKTTII